MRNIKSLNRQAFSLVSATAVLLATLAPGFASIVSADQATNRSIKMSSSAASATGVNYDVTFTVGSVGAGAYVIDFCSDGPVVNETCTAPAGFSTATVTTDTASTTVSTRAGNSGVLVTQTVASSATANVVLKGITNPNYVTDGDTGFYARVATYADATAAAEYDDTDIAGAVDFGGIALSTTSAIGVSAAVRETLTFCVAKTTISANCGDAGDVDNEPNVTLGVDGALSSETIDTGDIYTQLSTNALSGAVVNLKTNTTGCGGLVRTGSANCDIIPADGSNLVAGFAGFGIKLNAPFATSGVTSATGALQKFDGSSYNTSTYFMGYEDGDETGVTSAYGDPILDSNDAPVNNQNMMLTFGASISPNTPAGNYSADLSMIATGKY